MNLISLEPERIRIFGGRQLGTEGSELPQGSGHIPTGVTWPRPISDV